MDKLERLLLCAVLVAFTVDVGVPDDFFSNLLFDAHATATISLGPVTIILCVATFCCFVDYALSKSKTDAAKFGVTLLTGCALVRSAKMVFW